VIVPEGTNIRIKILESRFKIIKSHSYYEWLFCWIVIGRAKHYSYPFVILNVVKNLLWCALLQHCINVYFSLVSLAAKASLSFSAKESNQRKLPAAPASMSGSANCAGVVAEPDDAGYGRITEGLCFWFLSNYHWRNEALFIFPLSF
jgi:hypothetical protein